MIPARSGACRRPVVVVGAASRDLADDDPRGWRLGGGVSYSALTTARLGLPTAAIVGVDADAAVGVRARPPPRGRRRRPPRPARARPGLRQHRAAGGPPPAVRRPLGPGPGRGRARRRGGAAPGWILAPVAAELPPAWADVPSDEALVAVGWQGLLRELVAGEPVRHMRAAARTRSSAGRTSSGCRATTSTAAIPLADLYALLRRGASLAVTQGDHGGLVVHGAHGDHDAALELRHYPAVPSRRRGRPDRRRGRVPRRAGGGPDRAAPRRRPDRPGVRPAARGRRGVARPRGPGDARRPDP